MEPLYKGKVGSLSTRDKSGASLQGTIYNYRDGTLLLIQCMEPLYKSWRWVLSFLYSGTSLQEKSREPLYKGQVRDGHFASYTVHGASLQELEIGLCCGASLQGKSWEPLYKGQVREGHLSSYTVHRASLQENANCVLVSIQY